MADGWEANEPPGDVGDARRRHRRQSRSGEVSRPGWIGRSRGPVLTRWLLSLATLGVIHKYDVVAPPAKSEGLVSSLAEHVAPQRLFVMGHVLMADFHLNVAPADPGRRVPEGVDEVIYSAGEHGIGRAKTERVSLSPGHGRMVDELKRAFHPHGRLNPGAGAGRALSLTR